MDIGVFEQEVINFLKLQQEISITWTPTEVCIESKYLLKYGGEFNKFRLFQTFLDGSESINFLFL